MKSILFFLFALLIIISTTDTRNGRGRKGNYAVFKVASKKWARIRNTPRQCCNRKREITTKTLLSAAPTCDMLCPLLKVLKGCDFMCHFHLCYTSATYGGTEAACRTQCPAVTDAPDVEGTDTGIGIEGIFSSKKYALKV